MTLWEKIAVFLLVPLRLLQALGVIFRNARLFALAMIPIAVGITSFLGIVGILAFWGVEQLVTALSLQHSILSPFVQLGGLLVGALCAAVLSVLVAIVISCVASEQLIFEHLKNRSVPIKDSPLTAFNVARSILSSLIYVFFFLAASLFVLATSWIPGALFVTTPITFFILGLSLFDPILSARGEPIWGRSRQWKRGWLFIVAYGAWSQLLMLIPFIGVFLLPLYHIALTDDLLRNQKLNLQ